MAVNIFEKITNPVSGESFKCLSFDKESFVMEWTVQPKGYAPLEHIHLNQEKIFHVKSGELKILINKEEYIIKAGENITVPKGIRHIASNNKEEVLIAAWSINPAWVITNLCSDLRALQMIVSLIKKEA